MGLYLCVFRDDEELEGVEVGSYDDFGVLRDQVRDRLEAGLGGCRFPILMSHSDCDGSWSPGEAVLLQAELAVVARELRRHPPLPLSGWKVEVARTFGLAPRNLAECFFDVDGEPLFDRLIGLCQLSARERLPILFQ